VSAAEAMLALKEFERIVIDAKSLAPYVTHA
jgi:hypothetical protein